MCQKCSTTIQKNVDTWKLTSCNHLLCAKCFTKFALERERTCPCCHQSPDSVEHQHHTVEVTRRETKRNINSVHHIDLNHREKNEYITLHLSGSLPEHISLGPPMPPPSSSARTPRTTRHNVNHTNEEKLLVCLFKKLKNVLNYRQEETNEQRKNKSLNFDQIEGKTHEDKIEYLSKSDGSVLFQCLFYLAVGDEDVVDEKRLKAINHQIYLAAENVRFALNPRGSELRSMMTNFLVAVGNSNEMLKNKLLNRLGVCYSRQSEHRKILARNAQKQNHIFDEIELSKFDYAILNFDNIGFKNRQGFRTGLGYEQFTILKVVIIDKKMLMARGIYNKELQNQLCRKEVNWEKVRNDKIECSYEKIVKPDDGDRDRFGGVVLSIIESIILGEAEGKFPSLAECKQSLRSSESETTKPRTWNAAAYYGYKHNEDIARTIQDEEEGGERVIYDVPMYRDLNKKSTVLDIMKYLCEIKSYILENGKENKEFADFTPILQDARIAMAGDGSPIIAAQNIMRKDDELGDNVMAVFGGFHLMLELYKKRGKLFENTHLRNLFSMWRKSTKAQDFVLQPSDPGQAENESIQIHLAVHLSALRSLISLKRNNIDIEEHFDEDFKHIIDDEEDSEYEDISEDEVENAHDLSYDTIESTSMVSSEDRGDKEAISLTRLRSGKQIKKEERDSPDKGGSSSHEDEEECLQTATTDNDEDALTGACDEQLAEDISVTPGELLDFMMKRVKRNPQAFIVLLDLRFNELIFMLLRSETQADPNLYCSALKYAMLLAVNTNATNYVEMMANFNINRKCMSEAEKALLEEFTLFRKTKNGKTIFADRYVEWTMRDIRSRLGKYFKDSTPQQLTNVVLQMHEFKKMKEENSNETVKSARSGISLDSAFMETYVWCESSNLWLGEPKPVSAKPFNKRQEQDKNILPSIGSPNNLYPTNGGDKLMNEILSTISRGISRCKNYYNNYHVDGDVSETTRPHGKSDLKQVAINSALMREELDHAVSLSRDKLQKSRLYTVERIKQEIQILNSYFEVLEIPLISMKKSGKKKVYYIDLLIEARKELKKHESKISRDWEETARESILQRLNGASDSVQPACVIIENELNEHDFFFDFTSSQELDAVRGRQIKVSLANKHASTQLDCRDDFQLDSHLTSLIRDVDRELDERFGGS